MPISSCASVSDDAALRAPAPLPAVTLASVSLPVSPLPRTYFVGGHRVEHQRNSMGQSTWSCDCADYVRGGQWGGEHWCQHAEKVAAAAEIDRLLRTPGLIVSRKSY